MQQVTDAIAEQLINESKKPVVVYFTADFCSACKAFAPTFSYIANELEAKATFVKIDIDDNTILSTRYGIRSLPTTLVFKNGGLEKTKLGVSTKPDMIDFLKSTGIK